MPSCTVTNRPETSAPCADTRKIGLTPANKPTRTVPEAPKGRVLWLRHHLLPSSHCDKHWTTTAKGEKRCPVAGSVSSIPNARSSHLQREVHSDVAVAEDAALKSSTRVEPEDTSTSADRGSAFCPGIRTL